MSRDVDEKIVKMSLENGGFLSKIRQTIQSVGTLDKSMRGAKNIDLNRSVNSVNGLRGAIGRVSFRGLENGTETVKAKFSALATAATAAFATIVSRATNAGINMVKSFTMKPILEGLDMYSNKMKTIQVIQANTGASTGKISGILADLNNYANKTIYSFEDMTTNLGTFTAAGVGLKTARTDMIGLSNLAAASGSNTQQASMAMYQLSQAVAAGKVGLQDWNSVVNAGMGGQKFQNALKKTGMEMGKNIKQSDNFRESLKKGWLTSDVLNKTLAKFATDKSMLKAATQAKTFSDVMDSAEDELKSGWAQTWELILGNYNQAPKLFTGIQNAISNVITKTSNDRNELIKGFNDLGGRQVVIDGLKAAISAMGKVISVVTKAFHDIFPPATAEGLLHAAQSFKTFAQNMNMSGSTANKVRSIFRGFFAAIDVGIKVVKMIEGALLGMLPKSLGSDILSIAAKIGDMITSFDKGLNSTKDLHVGMLDLGTVIEGLRNIAKGVFDAIGKSMRSLVSIFKTASGGLRPVVEGITKVIKGLFSAVTPDNIAKTGVIAALVALVKNFDSTTKAVKKAIDALSDAFGDVSGTIKNLYGIKDALKAWTDQVKAKMLLEIAVALLAIAGGIKLLASVPAIDVAKGLEIMGLSLTGMIIALRAIAKISDLGGVQSAAATALIISISGALLKMAAAIKILSTVQPERMGMALVALAAQLGMMVLALKAMAKIPKGPMMSSAAAIAILSTALLELSVTMKVLSTINFAGTIRGLTAMGGIMAELAVFTKVFMKSPLTPGAAAGIVLAATGITLMSASLIALAVLPFDRVVTGLMAMGGILGEIVVFAKFLNGANLTAGAAGIVAVAAAIALMAPPIILMGSVPFPSLIQGLIGMAGALAGVVVAMKAAQGSGKGAAAIVAVAAGVALLVPPLIALSAVPIPALAAALVGLAAALGIIAVAARAMNGGAVGLLAFAAALTGVAAVLAAVSLAFAAFGLAVTAVVGAVVMLATMTAGQLAQVSKSFTSLLNSLKQQIPLIVQIAVKFVTEFAAGLAKGIPSIANSGLKMVVGLLNAINSHLGQLINVAVKIVVTIANGIAQNAAKLVNAGINLIVKLANGMANGIRAHSQEIVNAVMNLVEAIFEVVIDAGTKIIKILFGWIPGVKGAADKVGKSAKSALRDSFDIKDVGAKGGKGFIDGINSKKGGAKAAGKGLGNSAKAGSKTDLKSLGLGAGGTFAAGLTAKKGASKNAGAANKNGAKAGATGNMTDLGSKMGSTYMNALNGKKGGSRNAGAANKNAAKSGATGSLSSQGSKAGSTYVSALNGKRGGAHSAGSGLGSNAKSGSRVSLYSEGSNAGSGFTNGISAWAGRAANAAANMARRAKNAVKGFLGIASPSRVMRSFGEFTGQGFQLGIQSMIKPVGEVSTNMAQKAVDATKAAVDGMQSVMDESLDFNPMITPVLDTKSLEDSASKANNLLSASIGTTPASMAQDSVKMDVDALVNKLQPNNVPVSSDNINLYLTTYGNLDSVTARKWAAPIAEALEKVRRNTNRQGGAFA